MLKKFIQKYSNHIVIILAFSFGVSIFIPFFNAFCLSLVAILSYEMFQNKDDDVGGVDVEKILKEADEHITEQEMVIRDYENIFDSMVTKLPCTCGGNTFEGLFQPGVENFVECEKCSAQYKVMVSFDSILISDPLDLDQANADLDKKIRAQG